MVCTGPVFGTSILGSGGGGLFEGACGVNMPFDAVVLSSAACVCVCSVSQWCW